MADTKNNVTTSFKVDISNLKAGITEANRQIKLANAEFKAVASSMDFVADSADGIKAKLDQLNKVLSNQEKILDAYEKQLALTVKEQGEGSKAADDLRIKIANQKAAINDTKKQLAEYNNKLDESGKEMKDADKAADGLADSVKDAGKEAKESSEGFTVMKGVLADLAATAIKAVVQGLKDMASAAKEAWKDFDSGRDTIIKMTGATGEQAKELTNNYKNLSKTVNAESDTIAEAIGEVSTRFGVTGDTLENLSEYFIKFSEITGSDVTNSIDNAQKAMAAYGLSTDKAQGFLDALAKATQDTGVDANTLTNGIISNATAFQEMGLTVEQAVSFMGQLEKSGTNSETVLNGMRKALKNSAKDGKSLSDALASLQEEIEGNGDSTAGLNAAYDLFGKSGDQIYGAIANGTLSFKDLTANAEASGGTVAKTFEATQDATDKFALAVNGLKVEVGATIDDIMTQYAPEIESAIEKISGILQELIPKVKDIILFIVDHIEVIGTLAGLIAGIFAAIKVGTAVTAAFNAVLAANPIGLIITAIGALIAAFALLWNNCEEFREFWIGLWEGIKTFVSATIDGIVDFFKNGWAAIVKTWEAVGDFFSGVWDNIKNAFSGALEWFGNLFSGIWNAIKATFANVGDFFKNVFNGAKNIIENIWKGVTEIVKAPVNFLIRGLNKFIDMLNKIEIPDWVPGVGGYGLSLPNIPELKRGGVLARGQMGLLEGDGAEAVVPLENNAGWINATAQALKQALQTEGVVAGTGAAGAGAGITFNQYNNSPKALSRLEIYRQTQNQLQFARGTI